MQNVLKVLAALAAIAGIVYVIAAYGDKIVAWAKRVLPSCKSDEDIEVEFVTEETPEEEAEEEDVPAEETPVEEVVVDESEPVAEDVDFEA